MAIIEKDFMELTSGLDPGNFWQENGACQGMTTEKPRCSVSFAPDDHWLFEFMGVDSTIRYYHEKLYRDSLHRETNAITMQHIGLKFFDEDSWCHSPKRIENLFGCEFAYKEHGTPWFMHVTGDCDEFARILARAESTDLRKWAFSDEFLKEWDERKAAGKPMPALGTGSRGPATIMTSVLHPETLFVWIYEYPELVERFRDILADKMVELNREFCYPVLEKVLNALAPEIESRYQHSDSAMGHLLDDQYELGIRAVNYGPEVDVADIREAMPEARIDGHMPPFLLRNGSPQEIEKRVIEDFRKAGGTGRLNITTCGSLSAGTGVGRMRWLMQCVQRHCRYNGR